MKIIKSTDSRHLGTDIDAVNMNDVVDLNGFLFEIMTSVRLENGNFLLSSPNYQLECEE